MCALDFRAQIRDPENTKNRVIVSGFAKIRANFKAKSAYVYAIRALSGERAFSLSAWDLGRFAFFSRDPHGMRAFSRFFERPFWANRTWYLGWPRASHLARFCESQRRARFQCAFCGLQNSACLCVSRINCAKNTREILACRCGSRIIRAFACALLQRIAMAGADLGACFVRSF